MSQKLTADTLNGIWAAIPLSWHADYTLDEASTWENLRRLCASDVEGLYTTGSTGEFYALDWPSFTRVVDLVADVVVPSGKPLQIGCTAHDTMGVLRRIEYAGHSGANGVQIALPYWMEIDDQELLDFFRDVTDACGGLPMIHYNTSRAKRILAANDYRSILDIAPNLIGIKTTVAGARFAELQELLQELPELSCFVGEEILVSAIQLGARGCYSSVALFCPAYVHRMYALAAERRWDEAIARQSLLVRFKRELGNLIRELGLRRIDPVIDKGLGVVTGFLVGDQRTWPPYRGWSDDGVEKIRAWVTAHYPQFMHR